MHWSLHNIGFVTLDDCVGALIQEDPDYRDFSLFRTAQGTPMKVVSAADALTEDSYDVPNLGRL